MHRLPAFLLCLAALAVPASGIAGTSADTVDAAGLLRLARQHEHGEGIPRNELKAADLYCQAARAGSMDAQYGLGWMYANGRGIPRDDAAAKWLFRMAAEQGHEHAKRMLGFLSGDAVQPNCLKPPPPPPRVELVEVLPPIPNENPKVSELVHKLAPDYAIDPRLVLSIISVESAFHEKARSPKNAQGLMQLIPETAERFNVRNPYDARQNINGGLKYLRFLLAMFEGDVKLALAAYNAGERVVERYKGVPPYPETRDYVERVMQLYRKATHPFHADYAPPASMGKGLPKIRR